MISTLDVETVRLNPQEADGAKNEENASSKQHPHPTEPEAIAIKQAAAQNVGFIAFSGAAARARARRLIYFLLTKAGVSSQNDILQLHKSNCSRRQIYLLSLKTGFYNRQKSVCSFGQINLVLLTDCG